MTRTKNPRTATTPAEAGAQLGDANWLLAVLRYIHLSNWAPASAGVGIL